MIAVIVNFGAVAAGSVLGLLLKNKINENLGKALTTIMGLCTMVIGITSAIKTGDLLCMIICLVIGTTIGTLLKITEWFDGLGDKIKEKFFKKGSSNEHFTEGFVMASLLFCVGSMAIIGSFEAGVNHDYTIIFAKSIMDGVMAIFFSATMGIGVACSAVTVLVYQGILTLLATWVAPYLADNVITEMSAAGGVMLIGLGLNLTGICEKKIKVADMIISMFLPIAYIPLVGWLGTLF